LIAAKHSLASPFAITFESLFPRYCMAAAI
jgi:hypothetical protein